MTSDLNIVTTKLLCEVLAHRQISYELVGPENCVSGVAPLNDSSAGDLVWSRSLALDPESLPASIFLLPRESEIPRPACTSKTLIFVNNPRDAYRILVSDIFTDRIILAKGFTDQRLFSSPKVGHGVLIASDVRLGQNVVLHPNVLIYPNVVLGNNVEIGAGTIIGAPGYSYVRQPDGTLEHFPHVGGVFINDNVTIGANSCVDSGGLSPTRIGRGTKIGNLCQIAHNVEIGADCLLAGRVQIGGGTKIGDRTEIWPSAVISHKLVIGAGCDIKIGSVVVQDVSNGDAVSGNFAIHHTRTLRDFAKKRR